MATKRPPKPPEQPGLQIIWDTSGTSGGGWGYVPAGWKLGGDGQYHPPTFTSDDTITPFNPTTGTNAPQTQAQLDQLFKGLTGSDRDAAVALQSVFSQYGISTLAPRIVDFIKQGYSPDTISILLQNTDEYKQRFSGNQKRLAAGLPVLSPAEYLATESAYRQIFSMAGLPAGFYDTPQDFADFIGRDVSPTEVQDRVNAASELLNSAPPEALAFWRQHYSTGDMVAYFLDPNRSVPLIEKQVKAAELGGIGAAQGVDVSASTAERMASMGISNQQASAGFGFIAGEAPNAEKLGAIYGENITEQDILKETFFSDVKTTQKRKRLASKERATFGGSSGLSAQSLDRSDAGAF